MNDRPQIIAFAPLHNSAPESKHPKDATGAFQPGARGFVATWREHYPRVATVLVDNHAAPQAMTRAVIGPIVMGEGQTAAVAICCHGWKSGLQLGFALPNALRLAEALSKGLRADGVVALYACDAGRDADAARDDDRDSGPGGEGGFADTLRDALVALRPDWKGWIDAHTKAGHAVSNPDVRRFEANGQSIYLVPKDDDLWPRWTRALRGDGDLKFRFPLMTRAAIEAELRGSKPP